MTGSSTGGDPVLTPLNLLLVSISLPDEPAVEPEPEPADPGIPQYLEQNLIEYFSFENDTDAKITGIINGSELDASSGNVGITSEGFIGRAAEATGAGVFQKPDENLFRFTDTGFCHFAWIWRPTAVSDGRIFDRRASSLNDQYLCAISSDKIQIDIRQLPNNLIRVTGEIALGAGWNWLAWSRNHSTRELTLWVNGVLDTSSTPGGNNDLISIDEGQSFSVFNQPNLQSSTQFTGRVDEWGVMNAPMTAEVAAWLYNDGAGRTLSEIT